MATGNMYRKFGEIWTAFLEIRKQTNIQTNKQTYKDTDRQITILCTLTDGAVCDGDCCISLYS